MNSPSPHSTQPSALSLIATLGVVALISGVLVVLVYQLTLPAILENRRIAIERAIFTVLPGARSRINFALTAEGLERIDDQQTDGPRVYAGYDLSGKLTGVALEASAQGYQDIIRILYGYSPKCSCITGITVLESKETPGLGDKIETDPEFLVNFEALDGRLNATGERLNNEIVTVKHGKKSNPWEIDAISGATVSSKAIGRMLNNSAQKTFPLIMQQLQKLTQEES